MSRTPSLDWEQAKIEYVEALKTTGIGLRAWCELRGINYNSARRNINQKQAKIMAKLVDNDQLCAPAKPASTPDSAKNTNARSHGGYSEFLSKELFTCASQIQSLDSELLYARARLISVSQKWSEQERLIQNETDSKTKHKLEQNQLKLTDVEDRLIARIESLTSTLARLERHQLALKKDKLQIKLMEVTLDERKRGDGPEVVFNVNFAGRREAQMS